MRGRTQSFSHVGSHVQMSKLLRDLQFQGFCRVWHPDAPHLAVKASVPLLSLHETSQNFCGSSFYRVLLFRGCHEFAFVTQIQSRGEG